MLSTETAKNQDSCQSQHHLLHQEEETTLAFMTV